VERILLLGREQGRDLVFAHGGGRGADPADVRVLEAEGLDAALAAVAGGTGVGSGTVQAPGEFQGRGLAAGSRRPLEKQGLAQAPGFEQAGQPRQDGFAGGKDVDGQEESPATGRPALAGQ